MPAIQRVPPIHLIVRNGHATLTGVVAAEAQGSVAEMLAQGTFGVMGLENRLQVEEQSDPAT